MERIEVLDWMNGHADRVHDVPERVLSRCEQEVREHAYADAWLHARDIAEEHERHWRASGGAHASETFVAREVGKELARELKHLEPTPAEGDEGSYVDEDVLGVLEPEARTIVFDYVHDLARGEEHEAWMEVLRFTREKSRALTRDESLSSDISFEGTHSYADIAARVMEIFTREYQRRSHPPRPDQGDRLGGV